MLDQNGEKTGKDEIISFAKQEQLKVMVDQWKDESEIKTNDDVLKSVPLTVKEDKK